MKSFFATLIALTVSTGSYAQKTYIISPLEQRAYDNGMQSAVFSSVCGGKRPAEFDYFVTFGTTHFLKGKPYFDVFIRKIAPQVKQLSNAAPAKQKICAFVSSPAGKKKVAAAMAQGVVTLKAEHAKAH